MFIKEYIDSGILELYVAGALSEKESQEVYQLILNHPEIENEVLKIEKAVIELTSATAPSGSKHNFETMKDSLKVDNDAPKDSPTSKKTKINWLNYSGWAVAILFAAGFIWFINENNNLATKNVQLGDEINELKTKISSNDSNQKFLKLEIEKINSNLEDSKKLISILRDRTIVSVSLAGQSIAPKAFAKVYWDKKNKTIYLDAQSLPKPPEGKVYQLWSLTLDPFTSKSLGTLDNFNSVDNKIFTIQNIYASQAFGITLEPEGGSITPTLQQLYALGTV